MTFKVIKVFTGDSFQITPNWSWGNEVGDIVKVNGYETPNEGQEGHIEAKQKLESLILNREVDLNNPIRSISGKLLCDIIINGKNLSEYFGDFKASANK